VPSGYLSTRHLAGPLLLCAFCVLLGVVVDCMTLKRHRLNRKLQLRRWRRANNAVSAFPAKNADDGAPASAPPPSIPDFVIPMSSRVADPTLDVRDA